MAQKAMEILSEDFLHCTICKEPYKVPKMLPCLHSFCFNCLKQWVSDRLGQSIPCPTCRYPVDLRNEKDVSDLPINFFLVSLMERLGEISRLCKEDRYYYCYICKRVKEIMFCPDCKMHVCHSCKEIHDRLTRTSDHLLIPSEKLSDKKYLQGVLSRQAPYCNTHKQEKFRYFCTHCSQLACQVCAIVNHRGHQNLQEVENIVESAKNQLRELLQNSKATLIYVRDRLDETKKTLGDSKQRMSDLLKEVEERFEEIATKLQLDKERLTTKIRRFQDEALVPLKNTENNISDWLQAMENTQEMTRTVLKQNNPWEILGMKTKIMNSVKKLDEDKLMVCLKPMQKEFEFNSSKLGVEIKYDTPIGRSSSKNLPDGNFIGEVYELFPYILD